MVCSIADFGREKISPIDIMGIDNLCGSIHTPAIGIEKCPSPTFEHSRIGMPIRAILRFECIFVSDYRLAAAKLDAILLQMLHRGFLDCNIAKLRTGGGAVGTNSRLGRVGIVGSTKNNRLFLPAAPRRSIIAADSARAAQDDTRPVATRFASHDTKTVGCNAFALTMCNRKPFSARNRQCLRRHRNSSNSGKRTQ